MQAVAVAVAVVAVSVVACISCCQVSLWFKAHDLHEIPIFRVMFLNSPRAAPGQDSQDDDNVMGTAGGVGSYGPHTVDT